MPTSKTVTFNMARLTSPEPDIFSNSGPLLDDSGPYSGLVMNKLESLALILLPFWDNQYGPILDSVASFLPVKILLRYAL